MFKCVHQQTEEDIIILDPKWAGRLSFLRSLDRQDVLVCQQCRQPVRVRAGEFRRWHFAHKHLQNCPLQNESPAILAARAVLYEWLLGKFHNAVTLEKKVEDERLPRPIDCWVEGKSGRIAYWLIESRIKPQEREDLQRMFKQLDIKIHWVFLTTMLREDQESGQIHLTTTEREFRQPSEYDQIDQDFWSDPGQSLHYLDSETKNLLSFRSLHLVHSPQLYAGRREANRLSDMLVSPRTGEFVHPGEHEHLQAWKEARTQAEKEREEEKRRQEEQAARERAEAERWRQEWEQNLASRKRRENDLTPGNTWTPTCYPSPPSPTYPKEALCELCGKMATEWYVFNNATQMCKCMNCYRRLAGK